MILLDTNVLSELMRPTPDPQVVRWLDARPPGEVWISAVTIAEIRLGMLRLPAGKRKALLLDLSEQILKEDFHERCLPFDCEAALVSSDASRFRKAQSCLRSPKKVKAGDN